MEVNKLIINNLKSLELKTVCSISIDDEYLKYFSNGNILKSIKLESILNINIDISITKFLFIKKNILRIIENGKIHEFAILDKDIILIKNEITKFLTSIKTTWINDFETLKNNMLEEISNKYKNVSSVHQGKINESIIYIKQIEFNVNKTLDKNIEEFKSIVSLMFQNIDQQIKFEHDKCEYIKYKEELIKKLKQNDDDTDEVRELLVSVSNELNRSVFDEKSDLEENKRVFNKKYELCLESINTKRKQIIIEKDKTEFNLYINTKINSIVINDTYSAVLKSIIDKYINELKLLKYKESESLEQNKKEVDELASNYKTSFDNQLKLEELEKNKTEFSNYLTSAYSKFKDSHKSLTGTALSVYSTACETIDKIKYNDEKDFLSNCKIIDKTLEKWEKKIIEGTKSDRDEIEKLQSINDDSKANMELIKSKSKTIYNRFLLNPYFVLGLSINATQSQAMMVRDKVEKYYKLKITKALSSDFDLKNIDKPIRDLSTVQSAISSLKDTTQKFFWFNNDKYCKIWESNLLFDWLKSDKYNLDLMLACYFHLLVKDIAFTMRNEWNTFICTLNDFYKLSNKEIANKLIEQNRCSKLDNCDDISERFKSLYVEPFLTCLEYLDLSELIMFLNTIDILDGGDPLLDYFTERLIQKSDKIQIKISNIIEEKKKDVVNEYDFFGNLKIVRVIRKFVCDNYDKSNVFIRRMNDVFEQAVKNSITFLQNNHRKRDALKLAKEIYQESSSDLKEKLRYTFGYEKFGVEKSELTAEEMHDIGNKYYNGTGVRKNLCTALSWYKMAANAGNSKSMLVVALCYLKGDGCNVSKSIAKIYLNAAANAGEKNAIAILHSLEIPHEHYDLGYIYVGPFETKYVEVQLSHIAYVRVLSDYNYERYKDGDNYDYYGGRQTETPCTIVIPLSGHWHCVVDNNGDELNGIKSYSCYTKTISNNNYY